MSNAVFTPPPARRLLSPRRWRFWVIVADVLLMAGIYSIQHWPVLKLCDVVVDGPMAWQSMARACVTIAPDSNLLSIDRDALERRLALEFGSRAECRTKLQLPGTLSIRLTPAPLVLWTEGRAGISVNGSIVVQPVSGTDAPVWRTPLVTESRAHGFRAFEAAAAWNDVVCSDKRWETVVSELTCDPARGWILLAADGKTEIVLGWSDLVMRAENVACLLSQPDSIMAQPCVIDARFDRRLIVRAKPDGKKLM